MTARARSRRRWTTLVVVLLGMALGALAGRMVAFAFFNGTSPSETNSFSAAAVHHITISPSTSSITANGSRAYLVTAFDSANNSFGDVTSSSTFSILPDGSCTGSSCTATIAGAHTVTAHFWGLTVDATLTVNASTATKLAFTQSPSNSTAGAAFGTQPVVAVEDAFGNIVTTDSSTVTLAITAGTPTSGGPGTLSGCSQTETAGVITFSSCKIDRLGTGYRLHATDGVLAAADSSAFNVTAGAATQLVFTTQPAGNVAEATNFATSPVVSVEDAGGNVVTSDTGSVTLAINSGPGSGSLSCSNTGFPTVSAVAGVASFTNCQITGAAAAGTYTLKATRTGLTTPTSSNVIINVGPATQLVFTTQPGSDAGTGSLSPQPSVSVEDTQGNVESGDNATTVTLAIGTNPGSGTLACYPASVTTPPAVSSVTTTVAAGVASFTGCGIAQSGKTAVTGYTLAATSSPAHGTATSGSFSVTASSPGSPTSPTNGSPQTIGTTATTFTVVGSSFASGVRVTIANTSDFILNSYSWIDSTHVSVTLTAINTSKKTVVTLTNPDGGSNATSGNAVVS